MRPDGLERDKRGLEEDVRRLMISTASSAPRSPIFR